MSCWRHWCESWKLLRRYDWEPPGQYTHRIMYCPALVYAALTAAFSCCAGT